MDRKMKQIKSKSQTEGSASLHLTEPAEQGTGTSKLVEAAGTYYINHDSFSLVKCNSSFII